MTPVLKVQVASAVLHVLDSAARGVRAAGGSRRDFLNACERAWLQWPDDGALTPVIAVAEACRELTEEDHAVLVAAQLDRGNVCPTCGAPVCDHVDDYVTREREAGDAAVRRAIADSEALLAADVEDVLSGRATEEGLLALEPRTEAGARLRTMVDRMIAAGAAARMRLDLTSDRLRTLRDLLAVPRPGLATWCGDVAHVAGEVLEAMGGRDG